MSLLNRNTDKETEMDTATLTFKNQDLAKSFTSAWACKTLTGHDMSAKKDDGTFEVTVYDLDDSKIEWIDSYVARANSE